ncbi:MAG: hypothetical protein ACI87W_001849 [Halieaceae bacterium]|jgi:hypothetical protein
MQDLATITYAVLLLAHVLLFVYWLGADLAVLYCARYAANPALSVETRVTVSEIMGFIDMFPRLSVPLIGAVGLHLAVLGGYVALPRLVVVVAWLLALLWVANGLYIYRNRKSPDSTQGARNFDLWLRVVIISAATGTAVAGLLGTGHISSTFIAVKLLVFAAAICLSLILRHFFKPFRPALNRIVADTGTSAGSDSDSDSDSRIMQTTLARTRPIVFVLWSLTVVAAAVGLWGGG